MLLSAKLFSFFSSVISAIWANFKPQVSSAMVPVNASIKEDGSSITFSLPFFLRGFYRVIPCARKINIRNYECTFRTFLVFPSDCIKDFGVHIDCKIYFQHHLDFIFSHVITLQRQICTITSSLSTTDSVMMYFIRSDLSLSMLLLHGTRLQLLTPINLSAYKEKFQLLSQYTMLQNIRYKDDNFVEKLNLQDTAYQASSLGYHILTNIYNDGKCCPTVLETVRY